MAEIFLILLRILLVLLLFKVAYFSNHLGGISYWSKLVQISSMLMSLPFFWQFRISGTLWPWLEYFSFCFCSPKFFINLWLCIIHRLILASRQKCSPDNNANLFSDLETGPTLSPRLCDHGFPDNVVLVLVLLVQDFDPSLDWKLKTFLKKADSIGLSRCIFEVEFLKYEL